MNPKEKANELIEIYSEYQIGESGLSHHCVVKIALSCVDQIIDALEAFSYSGAMYDDFETRKIAHTDEKCPADYWRKVRKELEAL